MLKYATIDGVTRRLAGRITVVNLSNYGLGGITSTEIGIDLIELVAASIEEFMDMFLGMVYVLPLKRSHSFIQAIAEKLIVSEVHMTYFATQIEAPENTDSFAISMRQQALGDFQCLFNGLGIFVPGANSQEALSIQNDENRYQQTNKALILAGEEIKKFIGYDLDGDSISDTDLFKLNANVSPSFYVANSFDKLSEETDVLNGVRVRPRSFREDEISFW